MPIHGARSVYMYMNQQSLTAEIYRQRAAGGVGDGVLSRTERISHAGVTQTKRSTVNANAVQLRAALCAVHRAAAQP